MAFLAPAHRLGPVVVTVDATSGLDVGGLKVPWGSVVRACCSPSPIDGKGVLCLKIVGDRFTREYGIRNDDASSLLALQQSFAERGWSHLGASAAGTPLSFRSVAVAEGGADVLGVVARWPSQGTPTGWFAYYWVGTAIVLFAVVSLVLLVFTSLAASLVTGTDALALAAAVFIIPASVLVVPLVVLATALEARFIGTLYRWFRTSISRQVRLTSRGLSWPTGEVRWRDLQRVAWDGPDLVLTTASGERRWQAVLVHDEADRGWLAETLSERCADWRGAEALSREATIRGEAADLANRGASRLQPRRSHATANDSEPNRERQRAYGTTALPSALLPQQTASPK